MQARVEKGRIVDITGPAGRAELESGITVSFDLGYESSSWQEGWRVRVALDSRDRIDRITLDLSGIGMTDAEASDLANLRKRFGELTAIAPLDDEQRQLFEAALAVNPMGMVKAARQLRDLIERSRRGDTLPITDDDPWAAAARTKLATIAHRDAWLALLGADGDGSKPTKKWTATATAAIATIGVPAFVETIQDWFALVAPRPVVRDEDNWFTPGMADANSAALRNLVWACGTLDAVHERENEALAVAVGNLAVRCFTKIRGVGALSTKAGNACIYVLSQLPGMRAVSQLSRLGARIRYQKALALVDKAKLECAKRAGMEPIDLEELAVPTFGLDVTGRARTELGGYTAELAIEGEDATLAFFDGTKRLKSVPAAVKTEHADELKELKTTHKELAALVPTLRYRLERWLVEPRSWALADLHARYLDHPLAAPLARRLIYTAGDASVVFVDGYPIDVAGKRLDLPDDAQLALWHPLGRPEAELVAWRALFAALNVVQPIKQLERELYVVADGERDQTTTGRFANRTVRQHQLAALCRERGWTYRLQGGFDSSNSPTKALPAYGLQAAVEIGGGGEMSDAGIFIRVTTGAVGFYRGDRRVKLASVPARCFSETLRDVDLFVGVGG
jgi:Domain of unknown function (DUF4132)